MQKVNLIIDGSNLLHRVHWISSQSTASTIHMFMNSLKKLHTEWMPSDVYIAWDSKLIRGKKSFRKTNEDYKSNRDPKHAEQVYEHEKAIRNICKTLGVCNIHPGVLEADDVMYFLTNTLTSDNVIISSDHDMLQTISTNTCVYNPMSKVTYNLENFSSLLPVTIDMFIHYKALIGDKSDNIAGIKGVGSKTAVKIINNGIKESLTTEQYDIYANNLKLVDLKTATDNHPGERKIYQYQLENYLDKNPGDYNEFKTICEEVGYPESAIDKFSIFFKNEINNALLQILK